MLLQSLRAHCKAAGGTGSIWKYLEALVRLPGVTGRIACGFRTDLHFADDDLWQCAEGRQHRSVFPKLQNQWWRPDDLGSMPDDKALGEWELHTLEDMKRNYNHQRPIKYSSWDIIKSMRWLMRQPPYAEHLIYAPQRCFNRDTPPKHLDSEMHTADWWWERETRRDAPGW